MHSREVEQTRNNYPARMVLQADQEILKQKVFYGRETDALGHRSARNFQNYHARLAPRPPPGKRHGVEFDSVVVAENRLQRVKVSVADHRDDALRPGSQVVSHGRVVHGDGEEAPRD